jgi:hypothetical protein
VKDTIEQQIACVKRELGQRHAVYRNLVQNGSMLQSKADHEIGCMEAVLETLQAQIQPSMFDEPQVGML